MSAYRLPSSRPFTAGAIVTIVDWVVVGQVAAAAALGAVIGVEREVTSQPAGLRTHMLVCLGAALFTVVGADYLHTDPTRIAAQVVTGIGFLGGGAIVREGITTHGLTTAASLWVTAAIGVAIGLRQWPAAVITTVLALIILRLIHTLETGALPNRRSLEVTLILEARAPMDAVERAALAALPRSAILRVRYSSSGQAIVLSARPRVTESLPQIAEQLRSLQGVQGVEITR
jgi:putative Mg2+ transporter-C (MgtC) family protein